MHAAVQEVGHSCPTQKTRRSSLAASTWQDKCLSESDADHDLRFDYVRYSATGTNQHILRYTDTSNYLFLEINPNSLYLRQWDGGVLSTLDNVSTTVSQDTWYSVRVVLDGANVTVWFGERGESMNEVLSTGSATELTTIRAAYFRMGANTEHGWDNVELIAGTRETATVFAYNAANEMTSQTAPAPSLSIH